MSIKRQSTVTLVAEELRRRIISGELKEGTQLRQEALANEFGVSRIPVREALRQLAAEGIVEIASHRGAVVSTLSLNEVAELVDLRVNLEGWLLGLAVPLMKEQDLAQADAALSALMTNCDIQAWGELNWTFHAALYCPSGKARTLRFLHRINEDLDRYIRIQISLTAGQLRAHREHSRILELCRRGDGAGAVAALEKHILAVHENLVDGIGASPRTAEEDERPDATCAGRTGVGGKTAANG